MVPCWPWGGRPTRWRLAWTCRWGAGRAGGRPAPPPTHCKGWVEHRWKENWNWWRTTTTMTLTTQFLRRALIICFGGLERPNKVETNKTQSNYPEETKLKWTVFLTEWYSKEIEQWGCWYDGRKWILWRDWKMAFACRQGCILLKPEIWNWQM